MTPTARTRPPAARRRALLADAARDRGRLLFFEAPPGFGKSLLLEHIGAHAREAGFVVLSAAGRELERGLGLGRGSASLRAGAAGASDGALVRCRGGQRSTLRCRLRRCEGARPPTSASRSSTGSIGSPFGWPRMRRWCSSSTMRTGPTSRRCAFSPTSRAGFATNRSRVLVATRTGEPGRADCSPQLDAAATVCELAPLGPDAVADADPRAGARGRRRALPPLRRPDRRPPAGRARAGLGASPTATRPDLDAGAERAARSLSRSVAAAPPARSPPTPGALAEAVAVFEGGVALHQRGGARRRSSPRRRLDAADELSRVHILAPDDPLEFTHPLVRAAVYGALSRRRKAELHRRAATLLLAEPRPGRAGRRRTFSRRCRPATWRSSTRCARAARHALAARRDGLRGRLPRARAARTAGGRRRAPRSWPSSAAPRRPAPRGGRSSTSRRRSKRTVEPPRRAALALELGRALHDAGRPEDACQAFERGLAELGDDGGELARRARGVVPHLRRAAARARARRPSPGRRDPRAPGARELPAVRALMSKALSCACTRASRATARDARPRALRQRAAPRGGRARVPGGRPRGRGAAATATSTPWPRRSLGRALEVTRRDGWVTCVGAISPAARAPAAVDRPDRGRRRGRADRRRDLLRRDAALPAGRRALPDPRR